jgi:hypothetical protein
MPSKAKSAPAKAKTSKNAEAKVRPLSPEHQKMWERQNEYIKSLSEAPLKNRKPLSQDEVHAIGRAIGLWTKTGKLTASYKK